MSTQKRIAELIQWTCGKLKSLLGFDQVEGIAQQMVQLAEEDPQKVVEFAEEFLGENEKVYEFVDDFLDGFIRAKNGLSALSGQNRGRSLHVKYEKPKTKRKGKQSSQLPKADRFQCNCFGLDHEIFINCMCCGRVACEAEGQGPCYHCGSFVELGRTLFDEDFLEKCRETAKRVNGSVEGIERISDEYNSKSSENDEKIQRDLNRAIAHKEKLLDFEANSAERTKVIDDQEDYFELEDVDKNVWLDDDERLKAELTALSREDAVQDLIKPFNKPIVVNLDIENQRVVQVDDKVGIEKSVSLLTDNLVKTHPGDVQNIPHLSGRALKVYNSLKEALEATKSQGNPKPKSIRKTVVQHEDLDEFTSSSSFKSDSSLCLSMHQPWASLLVLGIKRYEGRSWPTEHRGRLWIASAAKETTPEEIARVENEYLEVYGLERDEIPFPEHYPTSCLLGCVDLVSCMGQAEFRKHRQENIGKGLPMEQSTCEFVFVCRNPQKLILPVTISGQHKLWNLERDQAETSRHGLESVAQLWRQKTRG